MTEDIVTMSTNELKRLDIAGKINSEAAYDPYRALMAAVILSAVNDYFAYQKEMGKREERLKRVKIEVEQNKERIEAQRFFIALINLCFTWRMGRIGFKNKLVSKLKRAEWKLMEMRRLFSLEEKYLFSDHYNSPEYIFSAYSICEHLGVSLEAIRDHILSGKGRQMWEEGKKRKFKKGIG